MPMPPWRGMRQVLAVGPWGKVIDKVSWKANKLFLKTTSRNQVLYVNVTDGSTQLFHKNKLPSKPSQRHLRMVAISDTHGKHRFCTVPDSTDILVHCGDIVQRYGYVGGLGGGLPALYDFKSWLRSVPATYKVFVGGNHDLLLEELGDDKVRDIFSTTTTIDNNIYYLRDSSVMIGGLTFYGTPWSPEGTSGNKAFQRGTTAADSITNELTAILRNNHNKNDDDNTGRIDVLMTHAACDTCESILEKHSVQCWVHGHWHNHHGKSRFYVTNNGCRCISINVASNDMIYRPKNPSIVMDVCPR